MTEDLLKYFGIISAASLLAFALIKYLSQKIFENFLQRSIESYKSNLEKINISHEIQYAALHKERAIVIKEIYYRLYDYQTTVMHFFNVELSNINPDIDLRNRIQTWTNVVLAFSPYFHKNRIYFNKNLCGIIDDLNNELDKINKDTRNYFESFTLVQEQVNAINSNDKRFVELKKRTNDLIEKSILPITNELETEFRKILGVESEI